MGTPKVRMCPRCGQPMRPVIKEKDGRRIVKRWECDNPNCKVVKVFSRILPKRHLEIVEAVAP